LIGTAAAGGAILTARSVIQPPNNPNVFDYDTYGVAICQEWVDVLTGEVQIERVDLLMDVGASMNPAVDIGQTEGGWVHGLGMYLTEFIQYDTTGKILTTGTWEYKPLSAADIPIDFRVTLMPSKI
jgi:xanthine dehydrogenase molybdopterin-binding subunit B